MTGSLFDLQNRFPPQASNPFREARLIAGKELRGIVRLLSISTIGDGDFSTRRGRAVLEISENHTARSVQATSQVDSALRDPGVNQWPTFLAGVLCLPVLFLRTRTSRMPCPIGMHEKRPREPFGLRKLPIRKIRIF